MPSSPRLLHVPLRIAMATALALLSAAAAGQPAEVPSATAAAAGYATGDAWIDGRLADIDAYAERYPEAFAAELERYAGVPRAYVAGLLEQPGWHAGDVWFACFLARTAQATCRSVVRGRSQAGAAADWRQVAGDFGVQPGSKAYADLRLALADSYRRWARPLQPDPALARALKQRAADATAP